VRARVYSGRVSILGSMDAPRRPGGRPAEALTPRGATASTLPPVPSDPNELPPHVRTAPSRNATAPSVTALASRSRPGSGDGVITGGMSSKTPPKTSRVGRCVEGTTPQTTHEPSACRAADIAEAAWMRVTPASDGIFVGRARGSVSPTGSGPCSVERAPDNGAAGARRQVRIRLSHTPWADARYRALNGSPPIAVPSLSRSARGRCPAFPVRRISQMWPRMCRTCGSFALGRPTDSINSQTRTSRARMSGGSSASSASQPRLASQRTTP
jgi:hypothetical protein